MKAKGFPIAAILLVLWMMLLAGCSNTITDEPGIQGNDSQVGAGEEETEETDKRDEADETGDDEAEMLPYYQYADIVYDRATVEGKFAVYFICGDASMNTYESNTVCGDSTLLIAPDGTTMLIDCNMTSTASHLVAVLQRLGITKLDYFVNTHPHGDHIGGWSTLLRYIDIAQVYINGSNLYHAEGNRYVTGFTTALEEKNIPYSTLCAGDTLQFGDTDIEVLWPAADTDWAAENGDHQQNENSIVMKVTYKDATFLFGGDIERNSESAIVDMYGDELQADIVKMNHHGYKNTSETDKWVDAVQAKVAVAEFFSAHTEESMYSYVAKDCIPFYTGIDKTVLVYTDGDGTYDIQVEKDRSFYEYLLPETENGHLRVE